MKVPILCLIVLIAYWYWPYPERVHAISENSGTNTMAKGPMIPEDGDNQSDEPNDNLVTLNFDQELCPQTPQIGGVPGPIVDKEQFCALAVSRCLGQM